MKADDRLKKKRLFLCAGVFLTGDATAEVCLREEERTVFAFCTVFGRLVSLESLLKEQTERTLCLIWAWCAPLIQAAAFKSICMSGELIFNVFLSEMLAAASVFDLMLKNCWWCVSDADAE